MKSTRVTLFIAALAAAALICPPIPRLLADDADTAATVALLTSGPWRLSNKGKTAVRVFLKDGTFSTPGDATAGGRWTMSKDFVVLIYADNHKDALNLPLNAKGTDGFADDTSPLTAVLIKSTVANTAPAPASTPQPGAATGQDNASVVALLTSGPWKISGGTGKIWTRIRTFAKDGTFTTQGSAKEHGQWSIDNNVVTLTFANGHQDTLTLPLNPKGGTGADQYGAPTTVILASAAADNTSATGPAPESMGATAPSQFVSAEMRQKAADLLKTCHNNLLFVNTKDAAGAGFIATLSGSNYLFTNAVLSAGNNLSFKNLDDTAVQGGAASLASGRDIIGMALPAGGKPLDVMQDAETNAAIGDDVVVFGRSGGDGVINTITGKIIGFGPDRVEIDAPFAEGDAGSPIIHLKTGKVIAVAAWSPANDYDPAPAKKKWKPPVRRFGYRLDNVKAWQAVDWRVFSTQAAAMGKIHALTTDLDSLFHDLQANKAAIKAGDHPNPIIQARLGQWLTDRAVKHNASDASAIDADFLSFLKSTCKLDIAAARQSLTYDYFQRQLTGEQATRDAMSTGFEGIMKEIATPQ